MHSPIDGGGWERGVFGSGVDGWGWERGGVDGGGVLCEEGVDGAEGEGLGALLAPFALGEAMLAAGEDSGASPRAAARRSDMKVSLAPSMPWGEALVLLLSV